MIEDPASTVQLLHRWHEGDHSALEALVGRDLPWIHKVVRSRLGNLVRAKEESSDIVQDVVLEFLRYGPRFVLTNRHHLRALLARIAVNVIRGKHDRYTALRRAIHRERSLTESVLQLDPGGTPSQRLARTEEEDRVRLALELLPPGERDLVAARHWDGKSYSELAKELGLGPDAVRMRFHRALARLIHHVRLIEQGRIHELLGPEAENPT